MCCFAQPVDSVSRTRIFGRLTEQKSQFVTYQMSYSSKIFNAMILPIPIQARAKRNPIRFIDLSAYPEFFRHLERGFPEPKSLTGSRAIESAPQHDSLHFQKLGHFEASFVPTINHFKNWIQDSQSPNTYGIKSHTIPTMHLLLPDCHFDFRCRSQALPAWLTRVNHPRVCIKLDISMAQLQ
ncbi:MAG TPA: hypothetical protein DEF45_24905 [Rhodopirellula sp.]|nr:hypothetical protein [Rhodopirellula sp.]